MFDWDVATREGWGHKTVATAARNLRPLYVEPGLAIGCRTFARVNCPLQGACMGNNSCYTGTRAHQVVMDTRARADVTKYARRT